MVRGTVDVVRLHYLPLNNPDNTANTPDTLTMDNFINLLYSRELVSHPQHLLSKLAYLTTLPSHALLIVLHDAYPLYATYGQGDWAVIANKNLVDLKWRIRSAYNPRIPQNPIHPIHPMDSKDTGNLGNSGNTGGMSTMSHDHVVHFSDSEEDAAALFRALNLPEAAAYRTSHDVFFTPYHQPPPGHSGSGSDSGSDSSSGSGSGSDSDSSSGSAVGVHVRLVLLSSLRVRCAVTSGACVEGQLLPLLLSPHYAFVAPDDPHPQHPHPRDETQYTQYYTLGLTRRHLVDDHTYGAFSALRESFAPSLYGGCFPQTLLHGLRRGLVLVTPDMVITDGAHRAALLVAAGLTRIDVVVGGGGGGGGEGDVQVTDCTAAQIARDAAAGLKFTQTQVQAAQRGAGVGAGVGASSGVQALAVTPADLLSLGLRSLRQCGLPFLLMKVGSSDFPLQQQEANDVDVLLGDRGMGGGGQAEAEAETEQREERTLQEAVTCLRGSFAHSSLVTVHPSHWQLDIHTLGIFRLKFDLYTALHYTSLPSGVDPSWVGGIFQHARQVRSPMGFVWLTPCLSDEAALRYLEYIEWRQARPDKVKHLLWLQERPHLKFTQPQPGQPYRNLLSAPDIDTDSR
ncbi:hypothetical protein B484DRAFT_108399 [Ochromonadaceae sp. CCMP2298]|nr:hypothetical protein B484DRAFT_108399 [Ochromonadaceae sp. CCMP2298]